MAGYYQYCNANGVGYSGPSGARAYLDYLSQCTYYGVRMSPEATWALGAKARDYLVREALKNGDVPNPALVEFTYWMGIFYPDWKPVGPDIMPAAYGWVTFDRS